MWRQTKATLEMIRFSHSVFALPFALLAAVMAWTAPVPAGTDIGFRWLHLAGLIICIIAARSAAMAFNRIADVRIDRINPRTKGRHLPINAISVGSAALFTSIAAIVFVAGTLLFYPNLLPIILAIPLLAFLLMYSYAKRFTWLSHFWLGAALMLAPIATWIAIRGSVVLQDWSDLLPAVILGLAVLFWVAGFDMVYACQDFQFDRDSRLQSVPARFGIPIALRLAAVSHLFTIASLIALPLAAQAFGPPLDLGWLYWSGIVVIAALLLYEHALVRPDDLSRVNIAFFHVNAVISIGLFLIGSVDLLLI